MTSKLAAVVAALLLALLAASPAAAAFSNGRAPSSALSPIAHPTARVALEHRAAAAWNTMRLCSVASGVDLYPAGARSAYRPYADQVYFWQLYLSGRGNLAARPGTSNHGLGRAIDLALPKMRAYIDRHGRRFGWAKVEAWSEWWHVNAVGGFRRPDPGVSQRYPTLRRGSGGPCQARAVREVQRRLSLRQDGSYGPGTARAVRRFQRACRCGLAAHGVMSAKTWDRLRTRSRGVPKAIAKTKTARPVAGEDVRALQGLLNARLPGRDLVVDGVFGKSTERALERFQKARGLPATGKATEATWAQLRKPAPRATPTEPRDSYTTRLATDLGTRGGAAIDVIVLHSTEGGDVPGRSVNELSGLAGWFNSPGSGPGSYHKACSSEGLRGRYVPDSLRAFGAGRINPRALHLAAVGREAFTRARWLARKSQLDCIAGQLATWSRQYSVPLRRGRLGPNCSVLRRGVVTHREADVWCDTDRDHHVDPGAGFPQDLVLARALTLAGGAG